MVEILILVASVFISLGTGVFVFARNPRHIVNRIYGLMALTLILFPIANYLSLDTEDSLPYIRAVIFLTTIAIASIYYFIIFMGNHKYQLNTWQKFGIFYTAIVSTLSLTPWVFSGLTNGDNPTPTPGAGAFLLFVHMASFLAASSILLISRVTKSRGMLKRQYIYMLVGILPIFLLAPMTSFVLPVVYGNSSLVFLSPVYGAFFLGLIGYAIVKHKLFDIRFFVFRASAYLISLIIYSVALLLPVVVVILWLARQSLDARSITAGILIALSAVVLYGPLQARFNKLTSRIFLRGYYDTQEITNRLTDLLVKTIDPQKIKLQSARILSDIGTSDIQYRLKDELQSSDLKLISELFQGSRRFNIIVLDEYEKDSNLAQAIRDRGIAVAVRLRTNQGELGYMTLGYRDSGEPYSDRDKQLLLISADSIAISLQNALHFQEIQKFNETLQEKINTATRQLRHSNEKLKELDESKDDFISMASHQLRTPLTSIKGYVSMVLEGDAGKVNDMQRNMLEQAFISTQRMTFLIADLLNLSRLKTGKFVIEPSETNIADLADQEVSQLQDTAKARNLTLTYSKPKEFPVVMLDETKTRQVVMNFIDNAIYYTPTGGKIDVAVRETDSSIEYTVTDNGIGVPKALQHHLFTKFYRAENAKRARPDGTGLGLFMAKKVIIAQGGAVIFKSEEGKGSTFGFTFPKTGATATKSQ